MAFGENSGDWTLHMTIASGKYQAAKMYYPKILTNLEL